MIRLVQIELIKLFRSKRTYLTFGITLVLMLIIDLGLYSDGDELFNYLLQSINDYFYLEGNLVNGYLISYLALNTLWVHIPTLIVIVTAHIFSSEFEQGTIRLLLTQSASRGECLMAKFICMILYVICFMIVVALSALIPSVMIFGTGDVPVFIDGIQFIQESSFLSRFWKTLMFSTLAMVAFSSLAMAFAIWFRNTLTAVLVVLGLLIVLTLLQTFVFGIFSSWQPFIFSYHIAKWQLFFMSDIPMPSIWNSVYYLIGMTFICYVVTCIKFNKMNISE
ncbi:ABC transporter permease [Urechidicola vernalis]|uniref:ABC transporter permease subunit n=1 Tax=Urechidicola vernalis TaxID=3075600 RepID=A0ABU2Y5R1_9FLAO|nr:ABC transporter permease [Urechidicola sp. P050]MDT0553537.1 ABC transporter permease subunit [Urechidicola sp. P050]